MKPLLRKAGGVALALFLVSCSSAPGQESSETPRPRREVTTIDVGGYPNGVAFAGNKMWVADPAAGSLLSIDPQSHDVSGPIDARDGAFELLSDGSALWVSNHLSRSVSKLDPVTGEEIAVVRVGDSPSFLLADSGDLWVLAGDVFRIDMDRLRVIDRFEADGEVDSYTVLDGRPWVNYYESSEATPLGTDTEPIDFGTEAWGITALGSELWVANGTSGTVSVVEPADPAPPETIRTGGAPKSLWVAAGRIWAADRDDGNVFEIDPGRRAVVGRYELDAPAIAITGGPDGTVWATSGDTGTVAVLSGARS